MINIYCDESCHLEHDESSVMVLGAMKCTEEYKKSICSDIREIKTKYGLSTWFEIKWTKVSASKIEFYKELIDYFFSNDNLSFRSIVAQNKKRLNHSLYNKGNHDLWYYKMYFRLLDPLICDTERYKIFIDIKDIHGGPRIYKLKDVLCNNIYDFHSEVIHGIYQVNSKESEILQLADLFIGVLSYYHRDMGSKSNANLGKMILIEYMRSRYSINMDAKTSRYENKYNLFIWNPEGWR